MIFRFFVFLAVAASSLSLTARETAAQALSPEQKICRDGNPDESIAACTRLLGRTSDRVLISVYHENISNGYYLKGDCAKTISEQNEAIKTWPHKIRNIGYYNVLLRLGLKHSNCGEYRDAAAAYKSAIEYFPDYIEAYINRGYSLYELHDYEAAVADLNKAIGLGNKNRKLFAEHANAYHNRALVWKAKGDLDRALADQDAAIRLNARNGMAFSNRGDLWRLKGDLGRSLIDHNEAIRLNPTGLVLYQQRGDLFRYMGRFSEALADFDKALSLSRISDRPIGAYVGKGLTFERTGDLVKARSEFEQALSASAFDSGMVRSMRETARSRIAAIDTGEAPPAIPVSPIKATQPDTIPTPVLAAAPPKPVAPARAETTSVRQGRRVALVIGNAGYQKVSPLANPQKDAVAIAASLQNIGFDLVKISSDASREKMIEAIRNFAAEADKSDWAVVYYAGHGIEVNGQNYLIPVDAALKTDRDVQFEAIAVDQIMSSIDGAKKIKLIVLDACRNNPFAPKMEKTGVRDMVAQTSTAGGEIGTRSIGRGLGEVKVQGASLVVFAAKHGQTALDGSGDNSPFAIALAQRMATPGVEINKIFRLVRDDVMEATAGRQEPYTYGSLPGREDFFFVAR